MSWLIWRKHAPLYLTHQRSLKKEITADRWREDQRSRGDGYGHQSTGCFFLPLSPSLDSRKAKSQNFSAGMEGKGPKSSHLFMTRGPGKGALWKKRVRKIYCFFLSFSVLSQTNVPELYFHEGSSSHKNTWNREENSLFWLEEWKSKRESWLLFLWSLSCCCFTSEPEPVTGNAQQWWEARISSF